MAASATDAADACNSSMGQRSAFVVEAARLIKESPILGHGAGGFYYENKEVDYKVNNPHNQYLLETIQSGVIGLFIFWRGLSAVIVLFGSKHRLCAMCCWRY